MTKTLARKTEYQKELAKVRDTADGAWAHIQAISRIRDKELYLEEFETFDEFLEEHCIFGKSHAYKYLKNAKTLDVVSAITDNAPKKIAHLEAIAKAPPEKQAEVCAEVLQKCEQENREPTAKDFAKVAKQYIPKTDKPDKPKKVESNGKVDEVELKALKRLNDKMPACRKDMGLTTKFTNRHRAMMDELLEVLK